MSISRLAKQKQKVIRQMQKSKFMHLFYINLTKAIILALKIIKYILMEDFMGILEAVIQGIVQGLTEFLPISSSGHLVLFQHIFGITGENNLFFDVMLHLGTLIAVLAVYYKLVIRLIKSFFLMVADIFKGRFKYKDLDHDKRLVIMLIIGLVPLFLLFLPIPGTDLNIKDIAQLFANEGNILVVGLSLILTSVLLTIGIRASESNSVSTRKHKVRGKREFNPVDSILVGLMQCVAAIFPGLSRSGSTLSVGLMRGINRQTALDYSFVLGIPSILAAAVIEFKDAFESNSLDIEVLPVAVGVIVSAVVGFLAIKLFKWLLATDKMSIFVYYTFIVGIATVVVYMIEKMNGVNLFTKIAL